MARNTSDTSSRRARLVGLISVHVQASVERLGYLASRLHPVRRVVFAFAIMAGLLPTSAQAAGVFPYMFNDPTGYYAVPIDHSGPAPVAPDSAAWKKEALSRANGDSMDLGFATSGNRRPVWVGKSTDKICNYPAQKVSIHVPSNAYLTATGKAVFLDYGTDWAAGFGGGRGGSLNGRCPTDIDDYYHISSSGLDQSVVHGVPGNRGHRGASTGRKLLYYDELWQNSAPTQTVTRRLQCSAPIRANALGLGQPWAWPMSGGDAGSLVTYPFPQGNVLRIRANLDIEAVPDLNEVEESIARGLQTYGCMVPDGGQESGFNIVTQRNAPGQPITGPWKFPNGDVVDENSLSPISFATDWVFVKPGYDPQDGLTHGKINIKP